MRLIDADAIPYTMLYKENWMHGTGCEKQGAWKSSIDALPTIEPEQHWIPCSERLPEKPNMYTVTDSKGDVVRFVFTGTESSRKYWQRCAKAWMPLPEPYNERIVL